MGNWWFSKQKETEVSPNIKAEGICYHVLIQERTHVGHYVFDYESDAKRFISHSFMLAVSKSMASADYTYFRVNPRLILDDLRERCEEVKLGNGYCYLNFPIEMIREVLNQIGEDEFVTLLDSKKNVCDVVRVKKALERVRILQDIKAKDISKYRFNDHDVLAWMGSDAIDYKLIYCKKNPSTLKAPVVSKLV
jgi:hypothetical protein